MIKLDVTKVSYSVGLLVKRERGMEGKGRGQQAGPRLFLTEHRDPCLTSVRSRPQIVRVCVLRSCRRVISEAAVHTFYTSHVRASAGIFMKSL